MTRLILIAIVIVVLTRLLWRLIGGIRVGLAAGPARARVPGTGARMVRDPVCGTFVLPDRAVTLAGRDGPVHFCSSTCRDRYLRPSA